MRDAFHCEREFIKSHISISIEVSNCLNILASVNIIHKCGNAYGEYKERDVKDGGELKYSYPRAFRRRSPRGSNRG